MSAERTRNDPTLGTLDVKSYYDDVYFAEGRGFARPVADYVSILRRLRPGKKQLLIDMSCGAGGLLIAARISGLRAIGVDLSWRAITRAREAGCRELIAARAEQLPLASGSASLITCLGSLEHYLEPNTALQEFRRILRDDGRLLITVPNYYYWLNILHAALHGDHKTGHHQIVERVDTYVGWKQLLEDCGLHVIQVFQDRGSRPSLRNVGPWTFLKRLVRRGLTAVMPLYLTYQFGFICEKKCDDPG